MLTVPVATNHQHRGDWPEYERAVGTFERERRLLELLAHPGMTRDRLVQAFLEAPLYRDEFASGSGRCIRPSTSRPRSRGIPLAGRHDDDPIFR